MITIEFLFSYEAKNRKCPALGHSWLYNIALIFSWPSQVETKDALLHAINEEYVEAVEVLLEHEESIHKEGELWVSKDGPYISTLLTPLSN